jgi:hypothetical protein
MMCACGVALDFVSVCCTAQACLELDPLYKPQVTFVIVQKRHNTRLLPETPQVHVENT